MFKLISALFLFLFGITLALPTDLRSEEELRYQYATDSNGDVHFVDLKKTFNDIAEAARFDPVASNIYHLFTRNNPTQSQPLVLNNPTSVASSNFSNLRRTVVLIHGWRGNALSDVVTVLVPAFLSAEDVNIIVVDWSAGASSINYRVVIENTISSGAAVARFIDWLNQVTSSSPDQYHVVGHGFGGHQAGIVGRNVQGSIGYITGLNPALVGWVNNVNRFLPNDGAYTEVIHTNYLVGYLEDLAQVDFYPNGGISMPGCESNACDDARSYFYFAESLASGGFTGRQCFSYHLAIVSQCNTMPGRLQMGGLRPKLGSRGVFWLETNASPPFSQG